MDLLEYVAKETEVKLKSKGEELEVTFSEGTLAEAMEALGLDAALWQVDETVVSSKDYKVTLTPRIVRAPILSHTLKGVRGPREVADKTIIVSDHQIPQHDKQLHKLFCTYLRVTKPKRLIILGDFVDNAATSRHLDSAVRESLQETVTSGRAVLEDYRESCGWDTEITYLPGNHEHNLTKTLLSKAPMLFGVRAAGARYPALSLPGLFGLEELDIEWVGDCGANEYPLAHIEIAPNFYGFHGDRSRKIRGGAALSELENVTYSYIQGHTHGLAIIRKTLHLSDTELRTLYAVENGTMCKILGGLGWTNTPDWANGWTEVIHVGEGFHLQQVTWDGGELITPTYRIWEEDGEIHYAKIA